MKKTRMLWSVAMVFLFLSGAPLPLRAEETKTKAASTAWTVDDVLLQESAGGHKISPDGKWVVWVKSVMDKEKDGRISHLCLSSLGDSIETIALTRGKDSSSNPKWSPSGMKIGFQTRRKEKADAEEPANQVWMLDRRGGEPWSLTNFKQGVVNFEWIDEDHLLLLAREDLTLLELNQKDRKDTAYVAEDQEHMTPQRLFFFDIKAKKAERVTQNKDEITDFALSHDKKWVLTRNNQSVRYGIDKKIKPKFFLVNMADKSSTELFTDPTFKPGFFAWAMDDKGFYFSITRTSDKVHEGPGADFLYYFELDGHIYNEVSLDWNWGLFYFGFDVREDGFITSLANGAAPKWRRYTKSGNTYTYKDLEGKHAARLYGIGLQEKGNIAIYRYTTAMEPSQWYCATLEGNTLKGEKQLGELNGHLKDKKIAKAEIMRWKGALDEEIEGILYYPHEYQPGKKYPLVLMIHGGPTGVDMDTFDESWAAYPNLMAQRGAFVLQPNYHGSGGYGQQFAESIKGKYYELEIPDIMNGIDELIKKGMVDPDKLGTMGWSNGGILSTGLTTWSNRFKVAGIGAADVNWISDYGNCAFGVSFDDYYFKGAPWDQIEHYIAKSPIFHLKDMKVPTIIFHGTEDTNVPYEQGWEYYRALQQIGKAPVKYIVFPGEPHGLGKYTHQNRKMTEELAWFDKHLFKTDTPANEALKKGSPLDIVLKTASFAKQGSHFGLAIKENLVPETVTCEGFEVGRFEVTRAQWAAFDKSYKFDAGTGNYPVSKVSFEKAKQYVAWLSKLTGKTYRLPKVSEAEKLAKHVSANENTLDYWASYSLNPDDAALLLAKAKELKGFAPLLLSVDKLQPAGEEFLYGLGGNVAEWAVDDKDAGKVMGKSAISAADAKGAEAPPPLEYVGLRVIKESK